MADYVPATSQLVAELYVQDIKTSVIFYKSFGFKVVRDDGTFVVLGWEQSQFYLVETGNGQEPPQQPIGNLRIMVPDVDTYWLIAQQMKAVVTKPIADRDYGLRDFSIAGPDGFALRFATMI